MAKDVPENGASEPVPALPPGMAYDMVLVDADAWDPQALASAIQALSDTGRAAPVLLVGERLPTTVVRNLLRLERSDVLEAPFTAQEVRKALFTMGANKAPGPDSFTAVFYQCHWHTVGDSVTNVV